MRTKVKILPVIITIALLSSAPTAQADSSTRHNSFWWPQKLDLSSLRLHDVESNPYGANFNYAKEFNSLDLTAVKKDIKTLLTTSQDWWPADYGNYGPFFIRMAWRRNIPGL